MKSLFVGALAALAVICWLPGCSKDAGPKAKTAESAGHNHDAHDHDHDSEPGHSHDDGHDHDHAEDHAAEHDEQPGHSHEDGHAHEHADGEEDGHDHEGHNHEGHDHGAESSGGVPIPAQVRENLGITFARAELRRIESTIRVPGRFEPLPRALREYHSPLEGRVELLVREYERVTTGMPLFRLNSSEWRRLQQELLTLDAEVAASSASLMSAQVAREGGEAAESVTRQRIDAADDHIASLELSVKLAQERERQVLRLQEIVGGRMSDLNEARTQLATLRNELSQAREDRAELAQQRLQLSTESGGGAFLTTESLGAGLTARRAEYQSARSRRELLRASLESIMGTSETMAAADAPWQPSAEVVIRASAEGVVTKIGVTNGGYVSAGADVMTVLDPTVLRFRAVGLQSDIARLGMLMNGRVLAPVRGTTESIAVEVSLAIEADPEERTLDLVADVPADFAWVRPGLSTDLELVLDQSEEPVVAIPDGALIKDGTEIIFFRRDPANPDRALRTPAVLGLRDGRWTGIESGLKAGEEVVLHGVYELKLATAAAPEKAGHFHADGTFHEGED